MAQFPKRLESKTEYVFNLPVNMTEEALLQLRKEEYADIKITLTDPKNGKQIRISAPKSKLMTASSSRFMGKGGMSVDLEFFCHDLQYSDKNP